MTPGLRVGLLFGGRSVEHEVSVISARGVAAAFRETAHECIPLAVTRDGVWLDPDRSRRILEGTEKSVEATAAEAEARLLADPGGGGLRLLAADGGVRAFPIDLLFPMVHGWGGEDGRLQGLLELAGVRYVGSGVAGSAVGMDKVLSKRLLEAASIDVVEWRSVQRDAYRDRSDELRREIVSALPLPLFVKPSNGGSSLGIRKVADPSELDAAIRFALEYDDEALVERGVDAREIECAVLGNDEPEASGLGEIVPAGEFYDYASKYEDPDSRVLVPAELAADLTERIRDRAVRGFRAHKLRGFARVDFLVERGSDRIFLNEVNTLPGFTPISMFPKLWEARGLRFPALLERLVELAREDG